MNIDLGTISIDTRVGNVFNFPITINIYKNTCVRGAGYKLEYDSNIFELIDLKEGTIWKDWETTKELTSYEGKTFLKVIQKGNKCSEEIRGIILNLSFKAKKAGLHMIKLYPFQSQNLSWKAQNSIISVK